VAAASGLLPDLSSIKAAQLNDRAVFSFHLTKILHKTKIYLYHDPSQPFCDASGGASPPQALRATGISGIGHAARRRRGSTRDPRATLVA
jgi:hypothetical protein